MIERDWYSIEDADGEKFVHYHGFAVPYWDGEQWSVVNLTWCYFPLSEVLEADDRIEPFVFHASEVKQYQGEVDEASAENVLETYYDEGSGEYLPLSKLTDETPAGVYWF